MEIHFVTSQVSWNSASAKLVRVIAFCEYQQTIPCHIEDLQGEDLLKLLLKTFDRGFVETRSFQSLLDGSSRLVSILLVVTHTAAI